MESTIYNDKYFKSCGKDINSSPLKSAREWILSNGGVAKAPVLARIFVSLFDNYSWSDAPTIPIFILKNLYVFNMKKNLAQWIYPVIIPIAYLKKLQVSKDLGSKYSISELYVKRKFIKNKNLKPNRASGVNFLIKKMIKNQKKWALGADILYLVCLWSQL